MTSPNFHSRETAISHIVTDEQKAMIVPLREQGLSWAAIAREVGIDPKQVRYWHDRLVK